MKIKITTFNCENLFGRYRFLNTPPDKRKTGYEQQIQVYEVIALEPGRTGGIKPEVIAKEQRHTTAGAILAAAPDILAVQEIENVSTLRVFNDLYCKSYFDRIISIDGNDARGIDVGLLIRKGLKVNVLEIRTHADEAKIGGYLPKSSRLNTTVTGAATFSRDCLEVDIEVQGKVITFLVNHFKAQDGKPASTAKRIQQSKRVKELVEEAIANKKYPVVMGDLNMDIKQSDYDKSINGIYNFTKLSDPFKGLAKEELWSHYYSSKKKVSRLDYILTDKRLNISDPEYFRKGLSPKCKQYKGARLKTMDGNDLEASDHCPTSVTLNL